MTPERWQQVKETLASALALDDIEERARFLAASCGDDAELRREVESLLAPSAARFDAWADAGGFLQTNAGCSSNTGRRVGAYQLVRELGRGGMGTVWLATRADEQFRKTVAIKLLKRGTDTDEVLRRFRAEREILARLEHPNIARLLDGGTTDDGLPYFVMEYVDGQPLTDFARERQLSLGARVELFVKICRAVQFAHQNLVVHRDLKPGNIFVTSDGEPKLLDFGIARLLDVDGTGPSSGLHITLAESRRLTPAYASPEQVRGVPITTASDVYTLGALLYELLSEQSPHQFAHDRPSPTELLRVIAEQDARRPSLVAMNPEIRRRLRGDLDNIVLRAMAREATRRYATANGLAEDLARHLAGRTVRARPDTFGYRATKFVQRNKLGVGAGALVAAALLAGVATTLWEANRAHHRFQEVRGLTKSYLFEIHDAIRDLPGSTTARQLIVTRALEYLDRLARDSGNDHSLQLELADAYLKVGDVQGKPYTANLGDSAGALRSYNKAAEIAAPLARVERGASTAARAVLCRAYENAGRVESRLHHWKDAAQSHRRAIEIDDDLLKSDAAQADQWQRSIVANEIGLGDAVVSANRFQPAAGYQRVALEHYRAALPICETLIAARPENSGDQWWLAKISSRIATELSEIGAAEHDDKAFDEALRFHLRALAIDEAAVQTDPGNSANRRTLADELIALAYLRSFSHQDLPAGLDECRRAEQIMDNLAASDPANAEARQDLSSVHFVTARVLQAEGDRIAAAASYHSCLAILEPLVASHPDNVETTFDLKRAREGLAQVEQASSNATTTN